MLVFILVWCPLVFQCVIIMSFLLLQAHLKIIVVFCMYVRCYNIISGIYRNTVVIQITNNCKRGLILNSDRDGLMSVNGYRYDYVVIVPP